METKQAATTPADALAEELRIWADGSKSSHALGATARGDMERRASLLLLSQSREIERLRSAGRALVDKLDNMTSDDFACGGESQQREALRRELGPRAAPERSAQ